MVGWCLNAADTNRQIWVCFEIHFAVFCKILIRNEQQDISYEGDSEDNTRWSGHIE
jgi:hypothetical protein